MATVLRSVASNDQAVSAWIGGQARACLHDELVTWPKPGLVSHVDTGAHDDMNALTFERSIDSITPFLATLAEAGAAGACMARLRAIGREAEAAMLVATDGVNTHRGAIFGLGLLCAAAGWRWARARGTGATLGQIVAGCWGSAICDGPVLLHSHGQRARRLHGAGGATLEAARGFPTAYEIGVPALSRGLHLQPSDLNAARVEAVFALIASLEDTNLLHRGGVEGLSFAQQAAAEFLAAGGVACSDWQARAQSVHESFNARKLSPGGTADLLTISLFIQRLDRVSVE